MAREVITRQLTALLTRTQIKKPSKIQNKFDEIFSNIKSLFTKLISLKAIINE